MSRLRALTLFTSILLCAIASAQETNATKNITAVVAGAGLTGGGDNGDVTLSIANAGVTAAMLANGSVVRSLNGLEDAVSLSAGTNVSLSTSGSAITINAADSVTSINAMQNDVTIAAGTGVTVTPAGNTLTIDAPAFANTGGRSLQQIALLRRHDANTPAPAFFIGGAPLGMASPSTARTSGSSIRAATTS